MCGSVVGWRRPQSPHAIWASTVFGIGRANAFVSHSLCPIDIIKFKFKTLSLRPILTPKKVHNAHNVLTGELTQASLAGPGVECLTKPARASFARHLGAS